MQDQHRRWAMGCGVIMALALGAMYGGIHFWSSDTPEDRERFGDAQLPPPPTPQDPTPREQIQALVNQHNPDAAKALCRRFIKEGPPEARDAALERLQGMLNDQFFAALNSKAYDPAHTALAEMASLGAALTDGSPERQRWQASADNLQQQWQRAQQQRLLDVLKKGDAASVDALADKMAAEGSTNLPSREYLEYLMRKRAEALADGRKEDAAKRLRQAAEVVAGERVTAESWGFERSLVEEKLREELPGAQLLAEGRRLLAAQDYELAACYLLAYREPQDERPPKVKAEIEAWWLEHLQHKLLGYEALLALSKAAGAGKLRWLPPDKTENRIEVLLSLVTSAAQEIDRLDKRELGPAEKFSLPAAAWQAKFEMLQDKLSRQLKAGEYQAAESMAQQVLQFDSQAYRLHFSARYLKEDVWAEVPAEVRAFIEKKSKDPAQRLADLTAAVNSGEYIPEFPGKQVFLDGRILAAARLGIGLLPRDAARAYGYFREVLRQAPQSAAAQEFRDALFKAIREARDQKDFGKLYDHAAVFIGAMGSAGAPPDLREELARCLQSAADHYQNGAPMRRVFMLSLLADVLAGDPRGKKAADEATALGFEAVGKMKIDRPQPPSRVVSSGLPGLSVVGIDNLTDYHLLQFFDGPEQFFVRVNPHQRGCVLLQDGKYTKATLITNDSVLPCKEECAYTGLYAQHQYTIVTETEKGQTRQNNWDRAYGDFKLLRIPPGSGPFSIDPETGLVKKQ